MFICDYWFYARHYVPILRQKRDIFEKSKKSKRYSQKNFTCISLPFCGLILLIVACGRICECIFINTQTYTNNRSILVYI